MAIDISPDVSKLRHELDEMRRDIKTMSRAMRDLGAEKGQEAYAHAEKFGRKAHKHAVEAERMVGHEIEERPFLSVLAAFGAGFLVAKLLGSGR